MASDQCELCGTNWSNAKLRHCGVTSHDPTECLTVQRDSLRAQLAAAQAALAASEREKGTLREALEPFAMVAYASEANWNAFGYSADILLDGADETKELTVGDFLKAGAALAASEAPSPWMPIESAPKDGTLRFFCSMPFKQMWVGSFDAQRNKWVDGRGFGPEQPTHWMPLPAPPAAEGQEEK